MFNIIIFGTGAAIYSFAVTLIMGTASLPAWLQVVLIWLTGVVGWLLLRPYRRITQLGGKDSSRALTSFGNWHRLFFRDLRQAQVVDAGGTAEPRGLRRREPVVQNEVRPETRSEDATVVAARSRRPEEEPIREAVPTSQRRASHVPEWTEPDFDEQPHYAIYRPETRDVPVRQRRPNSVATSTRR
jgi:hypothetical protein